MCGQAPGQACLSGALGNVGSHAFTCQTVGPNKNSRLDRAPCVLALARLVGPFGPGLTAPVGMSRNEGAGPPSVCVPGGLLWAVLW